MARHRHIPKPKRTGQGSDLFSIWIQAEKLMQIALVLPCAAIIGWLVGAWLDRRLHQSWISLAGIVFGGVSGLVYVVRMALQSEKDPAMQDEDAEQEEKNGEEGKDDKKNVENSGNAGS